MNISKKLKAPKITDIHFDNIAPLLLATLKFNPASKKSFIVIAAKEFNAEATVLKIYFQLLIFSIDNFP